MNTKNYRKQLRINPVFNTDAYKLSHKKFETAGTEYVQANFTPRSFRLCPLDIEEAVVFGAQRMVRKMLDIWDENFFSRNKKDVMDEVERMFLPYLGLTPDGLQHFADLHDLGYLPIEVSGLPEGSKVKAKMPVLFIENTDPAYSWLVTYLETWISTEMWLPMTSATTMYHFRKLVNDWATKTTGSADATEFQLHDFSFRGMGPDEAGASGCGFLLSSWGTDTIPALSEMEYYYDADIEKEPIAFSVPATEHSVTCVGIAVNGELNTIRNWVTKDYPSGIVSIVDDTLDHWRVITEYANELKDDILNRTPNEIGLAKTVFRPDSGDPVRIICGYNWLFVPSVEDFFNSSDPEDDFGFDAQYHEVVFDGETYTLLNTAIDEFGGILGYSFKPISPNEVKGSIECLWETFGGTTTEQGYKVLNERVGLIYGDSITYERAEEIFKRLETKGFASTNVILGVGSYTMRYVTRDTLGSAVKVTWAQVDGIEYPVAKDPITDTGNVKKSAKGYLSVIEENGEFVLVESEAKKDAPKNKVNLVVYKDDTLYNQTTMKEVRDRLWS